MTILVTVILLTLGVSAACSLFEATLYSTRAASLEAERGGILGGKAEDFLQMKRNIAIPTSAILILNTVANTAGATLAGMFGAQALGKTAVPLLSIGLTTAILFLSEILPKTYGATHWKKLWPMIVRPLQAMSFLLYPLILLTQRFAKLFTGGVSAVSAITEDEIRAMIRLGAHAGEVTDAEQALLHAVFEFDEMITRQVMVPRPEVVFLDTKMSLTEVRDIAKETMHTRFPLTRGSLDEVIGLIHVKDLIGTAPGEAFDLEAVMRPIRFVPESMPINLLLRQMQKNRQHMAVVVDEHGAIAGIVTLENIIEQIVGSVQDEFDQESPEIESPERGRYLVLGSTGLSRINRELGLSLEDPTVDSFSGYIVNQLGRLPEEGDIVELPGGVAIAEVLEAQSGRAVRVRLTIEHEQDGE